MHLTPIRCHVDSPRYRLIIPFENGLRSREKEKPESERLSCFQVFMRLVETMGFELVSKSPVLPNMLKTGAFRL